jgi:hypothetical protein
MNSIPRALYCFIASRNFAPDDRSHVKSAFGTQQRLLGVSQNASLHPQLESQLSLDENPESNRP